MKKSGSKKDCAPTKANERIQNWLKRINLKSKRLRNLIKKGIELSKMCDLDILMIIKDREMDKVTQYCSGEPDKNLFNFDEALKAL